jgi:uncharacterized protein (TIGR03083 family)
MTTTPLTPAVQLPQTSPDEAASLVTEQLTAYVAELRQLDPADWSEPTDCSRWDVRQIAAHIAGELDESAHIAVLARHLLQARKHRHDGLADAINAQQQADRRDQPGPTIVSDIERLMPKAVRRRLKTPRPVRRVRVPGDDLPPGSNFGYLFDVIYPRDVWLHRIDTARATSRPLTPTVGDHVIIAQVVRDLARSWHEQTWVLDLDGVGQWLIGAGQPVATVRTDATDYLRLLSGRQATPTLEISGDEDIGALALTARVAF